MPPHSSHSRPHGSMATGDRHGCIRQNMICRFFGPLRGWTPSNQLNQLKPKISMDFVICSRSITLLCQMPGLAVRVVVEQGGGVPKCLPIYHAVGSDARFPVRVAEEQGARGSHKV